MPTYDASRADCHVFTFKEGLLSPVAHDLDLRVTRLRIELDEQAPAVSAVFEAGSLRVVGVRQGERTDPRALGPRDHEKIEKAIAREVLEAARYPEIRFRSTRLEEAGERLRVHGMLELHGVTRPLDVLVRRDATQYVAEAQLHQPDFGIEPYSAAFGTLRVKPAVRVELRVPRG